MKHLNIYLRKDGHWEGRIYNNERNADVRRYCAFFEHTKEEAAAKMLAFKKTITKALEVSVIFSELYFDWEQSNHHRIKESTDANYTLKAKIHIIPKFGNKPIAQIPAEDIYLFIQRKQDDRLSNRYISDILILMKSVFKYGTIHYKYPNPMESVSMPKKQKLRSCC